MATDTQSTRTALAALLGQQNHDGGWGYRAGSTTAAEPTALASMALSGQASEVARADAALKALERLQGPNGAVRPLTGLDGPGWPTALAIMAWSAAEADGASCQAPLRRAVAWLLDTRGEPAANAPGVFGHDTTLIGWPWVAGTHSWVEPTAYAVMALRTIGKVNNPRAKEAVRLLFDRAIPGGGFNCGNPRVLGTTLLPYPATTGIALAGLAGQPRQPVIDEAVRYLSETIPHVSSPYSLAWGLIGLRCWGAATDQLVGDSLKRCNREDMSCVEAALCLLARSGSFPAGKVSASDV